MSLDVLAVDIQPWMANPNRPCNNGDPETWFDETNVATACSGCPVAAACLNYALTYADPITGGRLEGIWGGTTTRQRATARRPTTRCGTPAGFAAHKAAGEPTCPSCRGAHAAASATAKRTGTAAA